MIKFNGKLKPKWKQILTSHIFILTVLAILPSLLISLLCFISLFSIQLRSRDMIMEYSENLYLDQIQSSKQQNFALAISINNQIQHISWRVYILNKFWKRILEGDVIPNKNSKPSMMSLEKAYNNKEDPQLLKLFKRSSVLASTWFNPNHTEFNELESRSKDQFMKASLLDSLQRAFKNENMWFSKYPKLKIKDILLGFEFDGSLYLTGTNSTYATFHPPSDCRPNLYNMDIRCRFYYEPTMQDISIKSFSTELFYSSLGIPFLASIFCQKTDYRNQTGEFNKYSILCISIDLTQIPNFMKNFGSNSKFQIFIDPFKYHVIYHSEKSLGRSEVVSLQEFELQWLQSQKEGDIFQSNVQSFSSPNIVSKMNKIDFAQFVTKSLINNQKTFEYNRNGTECFAIMNRIVIYDFIPTIQDQQQAGAKFFEKNAFMFIDVLTKEQLQMYSSKLISEVKNIQLIFILVSSLILLIILIFQSIIAIQISNGFLRPIDQLTQILQFIYIEYKQDNNSEFPSVHSLQLKKQSQSPTNKSQNVKSPKYKSLRNNVPSTQSNIRQFHHTFLELETWEQNASDLCLSSETQCLYDNFQKLFLTLRFTTQNILDANESQSLLNLSSQIEHFKQLRNYRALGVCFNNMANIHYNCGRYKEALENYQHALIYGQYELQLYEQNLEQVEDEKKEEELNQEINKKQLYLNKKEESHLENSEELKRETKQNQNVEYFLSSESSNSDEKDIQKYQEDKEQNKQPCQKDQQFENFSRVYQNNQRHRTLIQVLNIDKQNEQHPLLNILNKNKVKSFQDLPNCLLQRQQAQQNIKNIKKEREILWWIIFHRKFNYSQALAGFIKDPNNKNLQLWEEMEQLMHELLAISCSDYLPQCNKRDMMILYSYSNALFNQNKMKEFIDCLSIYEQAFQDYKEKKQQTSSPKNIKIPKFTQYFTDGTPNSNQQNFAQNSQNINTFQRIQNLSSSENTPKQQQRRSLQLKPAFFNIATDTLLSIQGQYTPVQNTILNTPKSKFFNQSSEQIQSPFIKKQKQKSFNQKQSFSVVSDNQLPQNQDQNLDNSDQKSKSIKYQNLDENALPQPFRGQQIQLHKINSIDFLINEKRQSQKQEQQKTQSETNIFFPKSQDQKKKKKQNSKKNSFRFMNLIKKKKNDQNIYPQQKVLQRKSKILNDQLNSKIDSTITISNNFKCSNSENSILCQSQFQFHQNQDSQVKIISDQEKASQYQFNLDIYAQIFTIQLSNLQTKLGNYSYSAEILTEQLERSYVYLPHLKKRILKKLQNIFVKRNIQNPQLIQMNQQYEAYQNTNFHVCLISNAHKAFAKSISILLCKDIVSDILFKKDDQFALISFSQEYQIFDHLLSLTSKSIIMSQYFHFTRLLHETFLPQSDSSVNYFDESNMIQNQSQIKSLKKILQNSSQYPSLNSLYKKETYLNKLNENSKIYELNNIFKEKPICEEIEYASQKSYNKMPEQNLLLNKRSSNFLNSSIQLNDIHIEKTLPLININSETIQDNNSSNNHIFYNNINFLRQTNIKSNLNSPLISFASTQQLLRDQADQSYDTQNNFNNFNNSHQELISPFIDSKSPLKHDQKQLLIDLSHNQSQNDQSFQNYKDINNLQGNYSNIKLNPQNKQLQNIQLKRLSSFSKLPFQNFYQNKQNSQEDEGYQNIERDNFNPIIKKSQVMETDFMNTQQNSQQFEKNRINLHPQLEKLCPKFASMEYIEDNYNSTYRFDSRQHINSSSNIENLLQNKKDSSQHQKQQEMIFHLGVHVALKKVVLDSEQKITSYATFNKIKNNNQFPIITQDDTQKFKSSQIQQQKYFLPKQQCPPLQKTFLIYVTDQIFYISNHQLYQELCNLLDNLQIELLVLIENSYQSTLEESFLANLNFENKQTIQYFSSQTKLLQYIYNQRDIINHKLYPTIVEYFQTNFIFVLIY